MEEVVTATLEELPKDATHWSRAAMARRPQPERVVGGPDLAQVRPQAPPAGGWLTLPLDRDLIFVLMPDHKGRDVVAFSDGLQGTVIGFA